MKKLIIILLFFSLSIGYSQTSLKSINQSLSGKVEESSVFDIPNNSDKGVLPSVMAPGNDNCSNAIQITTLNGTCGGAYTLNGSTTDLYAFGCQTSTKQVWFYFVAQGPNVEITVQGGTITNPEIVLFAGSNICTFAPTITYGGYCASYWPSTSNFVSLTNQTCANPLVIGQTYYFIVDSWGVRGTFCISLNNPTPNPPATNCATANMICLNSSFGGNANLWGSCELTTPLIGGCLNQWGEVNSSWYVVYIDPTSPPNATLTFTISPSNGTDDYDYSIWKGATCTLGAPISCNFSSVVGNTGLQVGSVLNSQGVAGTTWNAPIVTQPGDVYIVLIDGYTPSSSNFSFNFGGTAIIGCTPPPILPIELLSFNIQKTKDYNLLSWTTSSEINSKYYSIERSVDGANWSTLYNLNGHGNSNAPISYNYRDYTNQKTINYYRLRQTDYNGVYKYFDIIYVDNTNTGKTIIKIINLMGQDVSANSDGVLIYYYSDGTHEKICKM